MEGNHKRRRPRFVVRTSPVHGKGVFANDWIRKGTRIIEYKGRRISEDEADRVYGEDDESEPHHTFLFSTDDGMVIDAAHEGNTARFINHGCDPNCEAVNEEGRIYIEAIRHIAPGEELCYDYAFEFDEPYTRELRERYPCYCGADGCRGTILAPKPKKRKKKKRKKQKK